VTYDEAQDDSDSKEEEEKVRCLSRSFRTDELKKG